jgi:hypothetical protein
MLIAVTFEHAASSQPLSRMLLALILSMLLQFSTFGMLIAFTFEQADSCHLWACCKFSPPEHAASTLIGQAASSHPDTPLLLHHTPSPLSTMALRSPIHRNYTRKYISAPVFHWEGGDHWKGERGTGDRETCSEAAQEAQGGRGASTPAILYGESAVCS